MITELAEDELSLLLRKHADLESAKGDGDGGNFLSGWQCENPWISEIQEAIDRERVDLDPKIYLYLEDDSAIQAAVSEFHSTLEGDTPHKVFCGIGSTAIIFTFCVKLKQMGITEVYYLPPLYFTFHFALKLLGIRSRPISGRHAFEPGFVMNLPDRRSVFVFSDPVWYAGVSLSQDITERLLAWQQQTSSLIFIDGSFQYTNWHGLRPERSAFFDPQRTFRLICPTKILAAHGYRFAYAIVPDAFYSDLVQTYSRIYGSASLDSIAFGRAFTSLLRLGKCGPGLMAIAAERHQRLRVRGRISAAWQPSSGYFVFERLTPPLPKAAVSMDGSFFEQKRYKDHRRINLLSPAIGLLDQ